ncbi:lysylphosphatidylglycerol synthase transmembrane domain-containing protein [Candidatus Viridilinea mediisalina]|uniref:TIGR00374 family protein n=1 Tax=Candidatus Viridilinea mediisalina TaxID=2024553 RepID=A0A2A6RIT4_9CHLR|nr:lysylphosphatidylglycerol synthase transmembrane domain-containing protein [Candidatus Viridilinea mediisalina]PDW02932.1 TIGR00374 family protein [Candidatus Viridilinea mediisalina]
MMVDETKGRMADEPENEAARSPEAEVEQGGFALWERLRSPRTLISFALAIAIVLFVLRGLDINLTETWQYIQQVNGWMLLLGLGVFYTTFPLRALRWRMLLHNAGVPVAEGRQSWASLPAMMEYIYLSWFANCIVPAKLGDAYRGYLLKHNGKVSFSSAFGTIFAERLLDMLGLFGLLMISAWITFGPRMPDGTQIVFGFGGLLVVLILVGLASMHWFSPIIRRFIPRRLQSVYERFEHAALSSFSPAVLPRLFLFTSAIWMLEGCRLYFVIEAFGPEVATLSLAAIVFVALASSLLTAMPITPAGLGVVEGTITAVLTLFSIAPSLGIAITFLDRLINFWSIVVGGFILYIFSKRR